MVSSRYLVAPPINQSPSRLFGKDVTSVKCVLNAIVRILQMYVFEEHNFFSAHSHDRHRFMESLFTPRRCNIIINERTDFGFTARRGCGCRVTRRILKREELSVTSVKKKYINALVEKYVLCRESVMVKCNSFLCQSFLWQTSIYWKRWKELWPLSSR